MLGIEVVRVGFDWAPTNHSLVSQQPSPEQVTSGSYREYYRQQYNV